MARNETWGFYPLSATRYSEPPKKEIIGDELVTTMGAIALFYGHQKGVGWRFVIRQNGYAQVGMIYPTKDELLADMPRYAESWGFNV